VLDINDNTPVFNEIQYSFSVPEGSTLLPASFNVSASDIDLGRMVVYAISLVGMRKAHLCWVSVMQHVYQQHYADNYKPIDPNPSKNNSRMKQDIIVTRFKVYIGYRYLNSNSAQ
jgi:hypothetical protein